jgi:broad specificity phosphatase PhoE
MTMHIILVRHATCAQMDSVLLGRSIDAPLDANGEVQARALAERLLPLDDLLLECSPRQRTRQTADAIALRRCAHVHAAQAMDESDFGSWSGRTFEELAGDPAWRRWNEQRSAACTPAGENIEQVQARAMAHLRQLQQDFVASTVAIVTHAEIVRSLVLHAMNAPIDDYHRIEISPASLTTFSMDGPELRLTTLNERVSI